MCQDFVYRLFKNTVNIFEIFNSDAKHSTGNVRLEIDKVGS